MFPFDLDNRNYFSLRLSASAVIILPFNPVHCLPYVKFFDI